jgi:hypothetical protein
MYMKLQKSTSLFLLLAPSYRFTNLSTCIAMKRKAIVIENEEKLECIRCDTAYRGEDNWSIVEFPAGDGLPANAFKICPACAADHMPIPKCKMIQAKDKEADEGNK